MNRLLTTLFPNQQIPPGSTEGLPYWIFWFMLCIILLLLAFIFLRDKELRRRLDSFFMGFRKKIKKFRLQQMLKREQKKIESTLFELGKSAWSLNIDIASSDAICKEIIGLEEKISELSEEKKQTFHKIDTLNNDLSQFSKKQDRDIQKIKNNISTNDQKQLSLEDKEKEIEKEITQKHFVVEDNAKKITQAKKEILGLEHRDELSEKDKKSKVQSLEKNIESWQQKRKNSNEKIKEQVKEKEDIEDQLKQLSKKREQLSQKVKDQENHKKHESKKFQKEIHEWEKTRNKLSEKINKIEAEKKPFLKNLGRLANEQRIKHKDLSLYYSKIDRSKKRIQNIKKQIEQET
ncbi:MAG: hypothetical protein GF421_11870 [Candidatus Aminicenantes bacterium]|nr:hypothetical protein [Candidatus Aminicenantes bacterium]